VCAPRHSCALYASRLTATGSRSSMRALTTEPGMVERAWDASGFHARIGSASPSQDSPVHRSHWRELYRAALLELDLDKLGERVQAAEEAISVRSSLNGGVLNDERVTLQDAMAALNVLKDGFQRTSRRITDSRF
jgi:hypothetical protein